MVSKTILSQIFILDLPETGLSIEEEVHEKIKKEIKTRVAFIIIFLFAIFYNTVTIPNKLPLTKVQAKLGLRVEIPMFLLYR